MNSKNVSEKLAKELEKVRKGKINKLKNKISSGAYRVNSTSIAKSLIVR